MLSLGYPEPVRMCIACYAGKHGCSGGGVPCSLCSLCTCHCSSSHIFCSACLRIIAESCKADALEERVRMLPVCKHHDSRFVTRHCCALG